MRGRTNIVARPTPIVRGDVKSFEVEANQTVDVGDFVQIKYKSTNNVNLFENAFQKVGIQMPGTNSMLIAYNNGDSASSPYVLGVFEWDENLHYLRLVSSVATNGMTNIVSMTYYNGMYVIAGRDASNQANYAVVKVIKTGTEYKILLSNVLVVSVENDSTAYQYPAYLYTISTFACGIDNATLCYTFMSHSYYSPSSSSTDKWTYYFNHGLLTVVDNGNEQSPTITAGANKQSNVGKSAYEESHAASDYPIDNYYNGFSKFLLLNTVDSTQVTAVLTIPRQSSSATNTKQFARRYLTIDVNGSTTSTDLLSLGNQYTYYPQKVNDNVWLDGYLDNYDLKGCLYLGSTVLQTGVSFYSDQLVRGQAVENVVIGVDTKSSPSGVNVTLFVYDSTTQKYTITSTLTINGLTSDGINGFMNLSNDTYLVLISTGYICFYYKDGVLQEGFPNLQDTVRKYAGTSKAIGFAKTGGSNGASVDIYVPTI